MYRSTPEILRFHPMPLLIFPLLSLYKWLKYEKTKPIEILQVDKFFTSIYERDCTLVLSGLSFKE